MKKKICLFFCLFLIWIQCSFAFAQMNKVGVILSSNIAAFIDMQPIESYNMNGDTYIAVEDLKGYGFDVNWNEQEKSFQVIRNKEAEKTFLPKEKINILKSDIIKEKKLYDVYETNNSVYLNGEKITSCYSANEKTIIKFSELEKIAYINWDEQDRQINASITKFEFDSQFKKTIQKKVIMKSEHTNEKIVYTGNILNEIPNGFGCMVTKDNICGNFMQEELGEFKNGIRNGLFFVQSSKIVNNCTNHFYESESINILNYENDKKNGYCIETQKRNDNYPCERTEGYYKNDKLNGWARKGENNSDYLYGFKILEEGIYQDNFLIDYELDTSTKENDIISIFCAYDYTAFLKNDNSLYISGTIDNIQGIRKNVPIKYYDNIKKFFRINTCFIITTENKLYKQENNGEFVFIDNDIKDVNEDCYLKENGDLYYFNHEKIADNVSKISGNGRILLLKNDGSVWYFRAKPQQENFSWMDEKDLSIPIKIMENCKDIITRDSLSYFVIKNDNTLWGWGLNYCGILLDGKSKQDNSYLNEIPDDYLEIEFLKDKSIVKKPIMLFDNVKHSAVNQYGYILKLDNILYQWGNEKENQKISPAIKIMENVSDFSVGSCIAVIKKDNTIWIKGKNEYGQLGNGTFEDSNDFIEIKKFYKTISNEEK